MKGKIFLAFSCVASMLFAVPASACMANGPEGYVSGLIWENRHTVVSDVAMVLKVEVSRKQAETNPGLAVVIIEGPANRIGSTIYLAPAHQSSCVGLGRLVGYVAVLKEPNKSEVNQPSSVFVAIDYLPSAQDRSRGMKRETNWFYPGEPAPDLFRKLAE